MGLGVKDSCLASIDHCTFYGVGIPVACYEKNLGSAGGNAIIRNSILSNSYTASYSSDDKSAITITNCISDNDRLPENGTNLYGNPMFANPPLFDYNLLSGSPAINASGDGEPDKNLGSRYNKINGVPMVMISKIFYNPLNESDKHEFIGIYNPSSAPADLSGYTFVKGITFTFPQGTMLDKGSTLILSKDLLELTDGSFSNEIYQWTSGSLENSGETLQLTDSFGIVVDKVVYSPFVPWPVIEGSIGKVLSLTDPAYDNHFGENWITEDYDSLLFGREEPEILTFGIYPNPSHGIITIETPDTTQDRFEVYTVSGVLIYSGLLDAGGHTMVNLGRYRQQILVIKVGAAVEKVIILNE